MQFSLRWLFAAITTIALYTALLFAVPIRVGLYGLVLITVGVIGFSAGGAIYGKAWKRAFWTGCLVSNIPCVLIAAYAIYYAIALEIRERSADDDEVFPEMMWTLVVFHILSVFCGVVCVLSRRVHDNSH